jgi:hypothetical protein
MDSRPIFEEFVKRMTERGAVPVDARSLATKVALRVMLPIVFEPTPFEVMAFGLSLNNSDFGDGALSLTAFVLRLRCTNYAIGEDGFRRVHLGGRLADDFAFSQATYAADSRATALATGDVVGQLLAPEFVNEKMRQIKAANEKSIDADKVITQLQKGGLQKGEAEEVKKLYRSADVVLMPQGDTVGRLAGAISLFSQQANPYRALELEALSGSVLGIGPKVGRVVDAVAA